MISAAEVAPDWSVVASAPTFMKELVARSVVEIEQNSSRTGKTTDDQGYQTLSSNILSDFVYGRVVANSSKMPSRDYIEDQELIYLSVEEVVDRFRNPVSPTLLVDCRPQEDFAASHIRGALNLTLPASLIMLRRLANGKLNVSSLISDPDSKEQFLKLWKDASLVLYDSDSDTRDNNKVFCTLLQRLHNEGCKVVCLQGKFSSL